MKQKTFRKIKIWWNFCYQEIVFFIILHRKKVEFGIFVPSWKAYLWEISSKTIEISNKSLFLKKDRFWLKKNASRQFLKYVFNRASDFVLWTLQCIWFWRRTAFRRKFLWKSHFLKLVFLVTFHRQNLQVWYFRVLWKTSFLKRCFWEKIKSWNNLPAKPHSLNPEFQNLSVSEPLFYNS